jgi:hypothetical protein
MEEAPKNAKKMSHSALANGMNESINVPSYRVKESKNYKI